MSNTVFKIGDRVRIINASAIESCELNKIGTIVAMQDSDPKWITYVVDMGRPRREREPTLFCWHLSEGAIELARKPNEQLLFPFMETGD
jgi:hypothetical protein